MDFESAVALARDLEKRDGVVVAGIRRLSESRIDSWGLDIADPETGGLITIDEKDSWEQMLAGLFQRSGQASR